MTDTPHFPETSDHFQEHCGKNLSRFKVPKRIFLVDSLPQSASGKIQKFVLKKRYS